MAGMSVEWVEEGQKVGKAQVLVQLVGRVGKGGNLDLKAAAAAEMAQMVCRICSLLSVEGTRFLLGLWRHRRWLRGSIKLLISRTKHNVKHTSLHIYC